MLTAMNFAEADSGEGHFIEGYGEGRIVVDGRGYAESLIVSPERIIPSWGPASAADLREDHLTPLLELSPQVVVIGTGQRQVFPDPRLYFSLVAQGVGVEIMDTGAACRTYNILMAEGRRVAAGLIMI
jgi:uncharacterized protein